MRFKFQSPCTEARFSNHCVVPFFFSFLVLYRKNTIYNLKQVHLDLFSTLLMSNPYRTHTYLSCQSSCLRLTPCRVPRVHESARARAPLFTRPQAYESNRGITANLAVVSCFFSGGTSPQHSSLDRQASNVVAFVRVAITASTVHQAHLVFQFRHNLLAVQGISMSSA